MTVPRDTAERVLSLLVGQALRRMEREADTLVLRFGARRDDPDAEGDGRDYELRVACAWRISDAEGILVGSGDLFTPADPDAELETFDWDVPGASWWDVRLRALAERLAAAPPTVTTFVADTLGGFHLVLSGALELDVFPNSSAAEHVETEFWRLAQPGADEPTVVVGTGGIELEA